MGNYRDIEVRATNPDGSINRNIFVDRGDLSIYYLMGINERSIFLSAFDQIISSFKFIE